MNLDQASKIFQLVNYFSVILLVFLLYLSLQRYAFSKELAAVVILLVLCINIPVSRTLIYQQVNILLFDLILLSLLFYPKHVFWSAVSLSAAIHIKIYPLLLALPFFYAKDWRWCGWFMFSMAGIVLLTTALNSFDYYIDFVHMLANWTLEGEVSAFKETGIRNVSVDPLVYNTLHLFGLDLWAHEKTIAQVFRLFIVGIFIRASWTLVWKNSFRRPFSRKGAPAKFSGKVVRNEIRKSSNPEKFKASRSME